VKTHSDITRIGRWILDNVSREDIRAEIQTERIPVDEKVIDASIDLCAGLVSMVEVGRHEFGLSGCSSIEWKTGPFNACLAYRFKHQTVLGAGNPRLGNGFTARNLSRIGGIKIHVILEVSGLLMIAASAARQLSKRR